MLNSQSTTLTFHIKPDLKEALRTAVECKYRSIANTVAVLVRGYFDQKGIDIASPEDIENNRAEHSA